MFTGIIQSVGNLVATAPSPAGRRMTVALGGLATAPISLGDSVCVSGVCLTVTSCAPGTGQVTFDVISETLRRTTLGAKAVGDLVNLELSLRPDSFVGGHFVQGHVDAVARVAAIQNQAGDWRVTFEPAGEVMACIVPKGSVTVDGVSMTIAQTTPSLFTLAVIPTTLEKTTLGRLKVGDLVNVETDILARTVVHYLANFAAGGQGGGLNGGLNMAKLIETGFA